MIPGGTDRSTASNRRVATAAMRGVLDALIHGISGRMPGLRGGAFICDCLHPWRAKITFKGARFVDDVAIRGSILLAYASGKLEGDLKIRGAGSGGVHLTGDWSAMAGIGNRYGAIKIRGRIDGRRVDLRIPAN